MPRLNTINAVNLILGLRGAQKREGEQWITQDIKDYQASVSKLNKKFCYLPREQVPNDASLRNEILQLFERHGPILWPFPDPSKPRDRYWLYKAPHYSAMDAAGQPSYPKDLNFEKDHSSMQSTFIRLLELRLIGYISNHVLNVQSTGCTAGDTESHLDLARCPSNTDSELTEMTEREDRRGTIGTSSPALRNDSLYQHEIMLTRSRSNPLHLAQKRRKGSSGESLPRKDTRSLIVILKIPSHKLWGLLQTSSPTSPHSEGSPDDSAMNTTRDTSLSTGPVSPVSRLKDQTTTRPLPIALPTSVERDQRDLHRGSNATALTDELHRTAPVRLISTLPRPGIDSDPVRQQRQSSNFEFAPVGGSCGTSVATMHSQPSGSRHFPVKEEVGGDELTFLGMHRIPDLTSKPTQHRQRGEHENTARTNTISHDAADRTAWLGGNNVNHGTNNEEPSRQGAGSDDDATIEHRLARTTLKLRTDLNKKRICTPNAFKGCKGANEVHRALMGYIAECLTPEDTEQLTAAATIEIVLFKFNGTEKIEDFTFKMALQADEFADGWIWLEEQLLECEFTGREKFLLKGKVLKSGG